MLNKPFPEILKQFSIDDSKEYSKLKRLFYKEQAYTPQYRYPSMNISLYSCCADSFINYPYRKTILSLAEFDSCFGFDFYQKEGEDLEDLIAFCEYVYNLLFHIKIMDEASDMKSFVLEHIKCLCNEMLCSLNKDEDGVFFIVKNDPIIESICSVVDEDISVQILRYTHQSLRGELEKKSQILSAMAKELEGIRDDNKFHYSGLFFYYANNCHVRHFNLKGGKKKGFVSKLNDTELEELYDRIFRIGIIAFAEYYNQESVRYLIENKDIINRKEDGTV